MNNILHLWNTKPVWVRFFVAICAWFVVVVGGMLLWKTAACTAPSSSWHVDGYEYPNQHQDEPRRSYFIASQKKSRSSNEQSKTAENSDEPAWICDTKLSDAAIVFLTICLVVVGWYTLRSADENLRKSERAYLFGGGPYGVPRPEVAPELFEVGPRASYFGSPWHMTIQNYGKTAGFVTHIKWGLCPGEHFPRDMNVSTVLAHHEQLAKHGAFFEEALHVDNPFQADGKPLRLRQIEFPGDRRDFIGWVFYGRIDYNDVFDYPHHSTFKLLLLTDHSDPLPGSYSDDKS